MLKRDDKPLWQLQIERILDPETFREATKISPEEWAKYNSCWERLQDPPEKWSFLSAIMAKRAFETLTMQEAITMVFHMGQVWEIYKNSKRGQDNAE